MTPTATALTLALFAGPALAGAPEVLETYADIAEAAFADSLAGARRLETAAERLIADPTEATLAAARAAWVAARVPYMQTEVFRFGNPLVDDWEGKVNAWPLDEGLIDYVDATYGSATEENALANLNVIASPRFTLAGREIDATRITPDLLSQTLHEADRIEANVATGWHAVEFLLWGQDLNGTGPGAGARPASDFAQGAACTNGHCDRRIQYLEAALTLLISDLDEMSRHWREGGKARNALLVEPRKGIAAVLTGMGSLSYGELAGERMKLGVLLNDPEEEQDCFSDNTHNAHYYDALGIRNVYLGQYVGSDGRIVEGESLSSLVAAADPAVDEELRAALDHSLAQLGRIKAAAEAGFSYDRMLARGSTGEALILAGVDALVAQTRSIERAVSALGLDGVGIEGSDSLDAPGAVFR